MGINYTTISGADIVKAIRKKNTSRLVWSVIGCIATLLVLFFGGYELRNGGIFYGIMALIMAVIFYVALGSTIAKAAKTLGDVENCRVFRKYGSPDEIAERISEGAVNPVFDSKQALVAEDFIMKHGDFETYIPHKDVLLLYRKEHRTNGVLDSIALVVHDRYGDSFDYPFKLGKKHAGDMQIAADQIGRNAPDARFGYTQDNLQYVKQNAQKI